MNGNFELCTIRQVEIPLYISQSAQDAKRFW